MILAPALKFSDTISAMNIPFKKEEKQPLNTPVIEMRKNSGGYFWWIVGAILVIVLFIFFWIR